MNDRLRAREMVDALIDHLDASPSPWHSVASAVHRLDDAGFVPLDRTTTWADPPMAGYTVHGASIIAYRLAADSRPDTPFRILGAHTDSPCLRIKPRPDTGALGWRQLAVEVYGGVLLNSWLDRDLGIAGRIVLADGSDAVVVIDEAVCRIPQLAIHLDREVNERGLVLDKQQHLTPVWGSGAVQEGDFVGWLADHLGLPPDAISTWELSLFDRTPASVLGGDGSLLASGRLDNQVSCWAAVDALIASAATDDHLVIALFDHEEVGSASTTGAAGPVLAHPLERITLALGGDRAAHLAALAGSQCLSMDNAHAVHPNYPDRHEPGHRPLVNHGPALKVNANQRYATGAAGAHRFEQACRTAEVPWQTFVSRNSMPCGSTIGPITATLLGIDTVDVGVPQLSMHSARELCGVDDPVWLAQAAAAWFALD